MALAAGMFAVAPWMIDAAPYEATMGLVYKIYFFHMPSAWMFLTAAIVAGVASFRLLFLKRPRAEHWVTAAAELAVVFGAFTLVTGPLWARKAWGVWWVWDARLTSSLMLFMIFVAYLLLRKYGGAGSEKLAAAVALFGMAVVPFVYYAVNIWRTIHPSNSVVPSLEPGMFGPFWFCVMTFMLFFLVLLALRVRVERLRTDLDELYRAEES